MATRRKLVVCVALALGALLAPMSASARRVAPPPCPVQRPVQGAGCSRVMICEWDCTREATSELECECHREADGHLAWRCSAGATCRN